MSVRRREHRWVRWVLSLGLVTAAAVVCYLVWDGYFRDEEKNELPISQTENNQVKPDLNQAENQTETDSRKEDLEEGKKVSQYEGEDANSNADLTGVITYVGESGGTISIWVNIDQYVTSGTCHLQILRAGGVEYEETVPLIADITTSTCDGFNFAREKLSSGEGEIVIDLISGDKKGILKGSLNL